MILEEGGAFLPDAMAKKVVLFLAAAGLVYAYDLSPYLMRKFYWIPRTLRGQILLVLLLLGAIFTYEILVD
jgi:hypothetical protein